ncbi:hypothetical protein FE257_010401 [Aspergillus nanangensis]|uniref:C2H2-type domain-containing protein n=1 Tax=Aspergillus nanangensis TaxID=2582783 RepID=A0AAD4CJC0_ASPNN|nr:hypothetical protein FE257_010401 [Aspergillus nanangensis]
MADRRDRSTELYELKMDSHHVSGGLPGNRYWALGGETVSFPPANPSPVDAVDLFSTPLGFSRENSANLAALAVPPPGMGTGLDALNAPQPLSSRRPGAPTLPSFELPAPNFPLGSAAPAKYPTPSNSHPPSNPSVSSLLTPPATSHPGETSTTAVTTTGVSASPDFAASYAPQYWQHHQQPPPQPPAHPQQSSYAPRQAWNPGLNSSYQSRDPFSPSLTPHNRHTTSPPGTEPMSQPYDMNQLPPFQQQPLSASLPSHPQHHPMGHTLLAGSSVPPHHLPSNDPYMTKSSSAPAYGSMQPLSSPSGGAYPPYGQPGAAAMGLHPPGRVASNPHPSPHLSYQRQPWPSYSLPAMSGPVRTNVHNPNSPMSLVGSNLQPGLMPDFNSGYVASMQHLYPHPGGHGGPGPTTDRPFKCDQCPQSFNRNHDLKRHKRIHLSVKPFPCTHCDKSFSRKDALKRHILVKGCGKDSSESKPDRNSIKEEDHELETNGLN